MSRIVVLVRYRAAPGKEAAARAAIAALVRTVLAAEPDCGGIEVLHDLDDAAATTLVEHWPSREIYLGPHMQQPHLQEFIRSAGAFLAGPPDISFWRPADDA
ncbi:MAG: antibiotic biosynthesis monooxygenase [Thermoanaerobaculia bacterium]